VSEPTQAPGVLVDSVDELGVLGLLMEKELLPLLEGDLTVVVGIVLLESFHGLGLAELGLALLLEKVLELLEVEGAILVAVALLEELLLVLEIDLIVFLFVIILTFLVKVVFAVFAVLSLISFLTILDEVTVFEVSLTALLTLRSLSSGGILSGGILSRNKDHSKEKKSNEKR